MTLNKTMLFMGLLYKFNVISNGIFFFWNVTKCSKINPEEHRSDKT